MTDDISNKAICSTEGCGNWIHEATHTHQIGPFAIQHSITECDECRFKEAFRQSCLVRKPPYRTRGYRPTKDGRMPDALKKELAECKQKQEQLHSES